MQQHLCVFQGAILVKQLDLSDLASVKRFASDFLATEQGQGPDLLILNAGVMGCPLTYTKDGFEMQIGAYLRDLTWKVRQPIASRSVHVEPLAIVMHGEQQPFGCLQAPTTLATLSSRATCCHPCASW